MGKTLEVEDSPGMVCMERVMELGADSWTNILIFVFSAFLRPEAAAVSASAASASHHGVKEVRRHAGQV